MPTDTGRKFPCPVCARICEVRLTKKGKPYVICDPCGIQVFVRGPSGIAAFHRLTQEGEHDGLFHRLGEMERRYRLHCPKCGFEFWAERRLIKTSGFDGSFKGFRCPLKSCGAIAPWEKYE